MQIDVILISQPIPIFVFLSNYFTLNYGVVKVIQELEIKPESSNFMFLSIPFTLSSFVVMLPCCLALHFIWHFAHFAISASLAIIYFWMWRKKTSNIDVILCLVYFNKIIFQISNQAELLVFLVVIILLYFSWIFLFFSSSPKRIFSYWDCPDNFVLYLQKNIEFYMWTV